MVHHVTKRGMFFGSLQFDYPIVADVAAETITITGAGGFVVDDIIVIGGTPTVDGEYLITGKSVETYTVDPRPSQNWTGIAKVGLL